MYERIFQIQTSAPNPYGRKHSFKLYPFQTRFPDLTYDAATRAISVYMLVKLSAILPGYDQTELSDSLIEQIQTIDLKPVADAMNRRTFGKAIASLEANGFLFKLGYHGHKYVVNPFIHNRLSSRQCRYVQEQLARYLPVQL